MRRRGGPSGRTLAGLALATVALAWAPAAAAQSGTQGPPIEELRRLADERESRIARGEVELAGLEARQDSLVRVKRRTQPSSAQFEAVSNRILDLSRRIQPLQRDVQTAREELRDLRTQLFNRYNQEIGRARARFEELKSQGYTPQTSAEMRRLVEQVTAYNQARNEIAGQLEEVQAELALPSLAYDPTDGPRQLRLKLAAARDAISAIDRQIDRIDAQIREIREDERILRESQQLRRDLEFWGDDRSSQSADELGRILEEGAGEDPFSDPETRIRRLQARRADLVARRGEYERKAQLFDQELQEFYS